MFGTCLEGLPGECLSYLKRLCKAAFEQTTRFRELWMRRLLKMHRHIWKTPNAAYQHKLLIPTAEHGDGGVMIWEKRKLPSRSPDLKSIQSKESCA